MNYCPNCGSNLKNNPTYCPNCGQRLVDVTDKTEKLNREGNVTPQLNCPKCGSENVQKYTLWKKSNKQDLSGLEAGIGCLTIIILLIFAPVAVLVIGLAIATTLPVIIGIILIIIMAYAIQQGYESNRYICLRCEHKFAVGKVPLF
jgi:hypothetical protein